MSALGH
jgi:hypothetical protein